MKYSNYLAYGSNMNLEQMMHRCPTAKRLGSTYLEGYELVFRGGRDNGVATIEPKANSRVPCLLWRITPADEKSLDRYEGFPNFYRKENVTVRFGGEPMTAMVYVMNDGHPITRPSAWYANVIREGYRSAGFTEF